MLVSQSLVILGTGLLAGIFLMGTIAMRPAAAILEATPHLLLRQQLIRHLARFMPVLMLFALVTSAFAVWQAATPLQRFYWIVEFALTVSMLVITIVVNVPINKRFLKWTPETLPLDWQTYVQRWNIADSLRLVMAILAFIGALVAGR